MQTERTGENKGAVVGCSLIILYILSMLTFCGIIGYVAYHFITKYW